MQQEQDTISIVFGVISYLRCLFSDESFQECKVNNLNLKILKNTQETRKMMEWITNINKNKENIHKVVLGVYSLQETGKDDNSSFTKETNQKEAMCNLTKNTSLLLKEQEEKENQLIYCETLQEMYSFNTDITLDYKSLCRSLQSMKLLRGKYIIKLKVYTTLFIEMAGFKRTDKLWDVTHLKERDVEGLRMFSNEVFDNKEDKKNSDNTEQIPLHKAMISCSCTINTDEKEMLLCTKCKLYVHASCHGYFSSKDKRLKDDFSCFSCLSLNSKEIRDCCLYRRALSVVYNENLALYGEKTTTVENKVLIFTRQELSDFLQARIGFSKIFSTLIIKKMIEDGFLITSTKYKLQLVKSRDIKEKIKGYFNGKKMECLIAMCDIKCNIL